MLAVVDFLTVLWLAGCALYSLRALSKGARQSLHYVILVHFLFCGVPLALDLWIGVPDYSNAVSFAHAAQDSTISLLYCAYVAAAPAIWLLMMRGWRGGRDPSAGGPHASSYTAPPGVQRYRWLLPLLYVVMISPIAVVVLAPDPTIYASYAPFLRADQGSAEVEFQTRWVTFASLASILGCAAAIVVTPRISFSTACFYAACLFQSVWLQGKRFTIALAILSVLSALWQRGSLRGRRFVLACAVGLAVLGAFSAWYQSAFRGRDIANAAESYENYREDYGRDGVIKQALYAELHPEEGRLLDYRGQSLLYDLTFIIPRHWWPEKPWPYSVYATAAMLGMAEHYYVGYAATTSFLDEAVANFGWLGLLLGPWLIGVVCYLGDHSPWPLIRLLTYAIGPLMLVQDIGVYISIFALWLILAVYSQYSPWARRARVMPAHAAGYVDAQTS